MINIRQYLNRKFKAPKFAGFKGLGVVGIDASSEENGIRKPLLIDYSKKVLFELSNTTQGWVPMGNTKAVMTLSGWRIQKKKTK